MGSREPPRKLPGLYPWRVACLQAWGRAWGRPRGSGHGGSPTSSPCPRPLWPHRLPGQGWKLAPRGLAAHGPVCLKGNESSRQKGVPTPSPSGSGEPASVQAWPRGLRRTEPDPARLAPGCTLPRACTPQLLPPAPPREARLACTGGTACTWCPEASMPAGAVWSDWKPEPHRSRAPTPCRPPVPQAVLCFTPTPEVGGRAAQPGGA